MDMYSAMILGFILFAGAVVTGSLYVILSIRWYPLLAEEEGDK